MPTAQALAVAGLHSHSPIGFWEPLAEVSCAPSSQFLTVRRRADRCTSPCTERLEKAPEGSGKGARQRVAPACPCSWRTLPAARRPPYGRGSLTLGPRPQGRLRQQAKRILGAFEAMRAWRALRSSADMAALHKSPIVQLLWKERANAARVTAGAKAQEQLLTKTPQSSRRLARLRKTARHLRR